MNTYVLFLLLFSLITTSLPAVGYSQAVGTATGTATAPYASALAAIESKADARRQELGIPGMSLVIVKDDQIIYMKGLGNKDFDNKVAVTPDTQFAIGSATKAFTALSVLLAQDEGKLSLDDHPRKFLPYFKMYDPETDKSITIRDLLSHSSGLNRTDLAMITGKLTRAELIEVAAQAKPTAKLREKFQYQNLMFTAAGEIVAKIENRSWEKIVPEKILKPLGMTNTTMSIADMEKAKDRSLGYEYNFDTKETRIRPYRSIDQVAPAGSINSSARDMGTWLRFVLNGGSLDGKRIVSEKSFAEWLKPQMKMTPDGKRSYGLGWFLEEWNGLKVVQHAGNIDGFNSMVAMIPEKKLGFVMLTNVTGSPLGTELMPMIWKSILEEPKSETPAGAYDKLVGKYKLGATGREVEVKTEGGKLIMIVPGQPPYTLDSTGGRNFAPAGAPPGFAANFHPAEGDVTELELVQPNGSNKLPRVTSANGDAGAPAAAPSTAAREMIGEYLTPGGTGTINVKDNDGKVTFNITGQPPYELKDKAKDQFFLGGLPEAYWLRAKRDEAGKLIALVITQPEGEFEFKRKDASTAKPPIEIDELMQKAIDAIGGEANLRKLTSRVMEGDVDMENQGVKGSVITYSKAPNMTANEMTMTALGKTIATGWDYFDGTTGEEVYTFAPVEKYAGKKLADVKIGADFYGPLNWKSNYKKAEVRGIKKVGEEEAYVVALETENGTSATEYYSTKTFLLLKRDGFSASSTNQRQSPYTVLYSDYREVDGVKLPFKTVNNTTSMGDIVTVIRKVKHNVALDDKLFAPRKVDVK